MRDAEGPGAAGGARGGAFLGGVERARVEHRPKEEAEDELGGGPVVACDDVGGVVGGALGGGKECVVFNLSSGVGKMGMVRIVG